MHTERNVAKVTACTPFRRAALFAAMAVALLAGYAFTRPFALAPFTFAELPDGGVYANAYARAEFASGSSPLAFFGKMVVGLVWLLALTGVLLQKVSGRRLLVALLALGAVKFLVLALIGHPILRWSWSWALTAAVMGADAVGGLGLLRVLGLRGRAEGDGALLCLGAGLGMGLHALVVFGLGAVGVLHPAALLLPPVFGVVMFRSEVRAFAAVLTDRGRRWVHHRDPVVRVAFVLLALLVALNLNAAAFPEMEYDALEYHLAAPAEYLRRGRIAFLDHNTLANLPQVAEMFYLMAGAVGGFEGQVMGTMIAAHLFHAWAGVWMVIAVCALAGRMAGGRASLAAALAAASGLWVTSLSQTAYVELFTAFFGVCTFLAIGRGIRPRFEPRNSDAGDVPPPPDRGLRWVVLAGVMAGFAAASKYPAALFLAAPALPAAVWVFCGRVRPLTAATCFIAAAAVTFLPWTVRGIAGAHDPIYPLLTARRDAGTGAPESCAVAGGAFWSPAQCARWNAALRPTRSAPRALGALFAGRGLVDQHRGFERLHLTPLLGLFLVPAVFAVRKRALAIWIAFAVMWGCAAWALATHQVQRFLYPTLPLAAVLTAPGLEWVAGHGSRHRAARSVLLGAAAVVAAVLVPVNVANNFGLAAQLDMIFRSSERARARDEMRFFADTHNEQYLPRGDAWRTLMALDDGSHVYLVGEARTAVLHRAGLIVTYATVFDRHPIEALVQEASSAGDLAAGLRSRGVTHVYVDWVEVRRLARTYRGGLFGWSPREWGRFTAFLDAQRKVPLAADGGAPMLVGAPRDGTLVPRWLRNELSASRGNRREVLELFTLKEAGRARVP